MGRLMAIVMAAGMAVGAYGQTWLVKDGQARAEIVIAGQPVPAAAVAGAELLRPWIEARAGTDFAELANSLEDQKAFQNLALDMLQHLELTRTQDQQEPESEEEESLSDDEDEQQEAPDSPAEDQPNEMAAEPSEGGEENDSEAEMERPDDSADADSEEEGDEGMLPTRPNRPWTDIPDGFDYRAFTEEFDEVVGAAELCDEEELGRLRAYLDAQLKGLQGVVTRLANRLQRKLMAQAVHARRQPELTLVDQDVQVMHVQRDEVSPA